jgi:hypothetical protein
MSFFKPEFLWGTLFIGAVLLIHLLRRPRTRMLHFSTLRFFRNAAVNAHRMRRLRDILLLIARLLAVGAIALLFAQPYFSGNPMSLLRNPHLTLFSWVDPTPSMGYRNNGSTLYEKGIALIDSVNAKMSATARHFSYDEAANDFVLRQNENLSHDAIIRHGPCGFNNVAQAWSLRSKQYSFPTLLIASDFERATTASLDSLLDSMPTGAAIVCLSLAPEKRWNFSLHTIEVLNAGDKAALGATIVARGKPIDSGKVSLSLSGLYSGGTRVSVARNDSGSVRLEAENATFGPGGSLSLEVQDPLMFDNTGYYTLSKHGGMSVVTIGDSQRTFPLAAAFSAISGRQWSPVMQKRPEEATYDLLDSAGVIAVPSFNTFLPALESVLSHATTVGKAIIIALDPHEEAITAILGLLDNIKIKAVSLKPVHRDTPVTLMLPDTISDLWRGFPMQAVKEAAIYEYVEGLPGIPLVRLDNGTPLFTLVSEKNGNSLILVATPLGVSEANNLCETGFYVACIDRVTRHALRSLILPQDEWIAGIERRNPFHGLKTAAKVYNSEGAFTDRWQSQQNVVIKEPGIYRIAPENETAYWITVSSDPSEGTLECIPPTPHDRSKQSIIVVNEAQFLEAIQGKDTLFWMLPWFLLLLFLLAEVVLWKKPSIFKK